MEIESVSVEQDRVAQPSWDTSVAGWWNVVRRDPRWWFAPILLAFVVFAVGAPWLSRYDPLASNVLQAQQAPSLAHWLGTESLGRDQFSRVVWGARLSLTVG